MGFSHISLALSIEKCELLRDVVAPWALKDSVWKSLRCWNKVMEPVADIVDLIVRTAREIELFRALFQDTWNYNAPKWTKIQVPSNKIDPSMFFGTARAVQSHASSFFKVVLVPKWFNLIIIYIIHSEPIANQKNVIWLSCSIRSDWSILTRFLYRKRSSVTL